MKYDHIFTFLHTTIIKDFHLADICFSKQSVLPMQVILAVYSAAGAVNKKISKANILQIWHRELPRKNGRLVLPFYAKFRADGLNLPVTLYTTFYTQLYTAKGVTLFT